MFRAVCVILVSLVIYAESAVTLNQPKQTLITRPGDSSRIDCEVEGINFVKLIIHWYRQKDGEDLKRVLYSTASKTESDDKSSIGIMSERNSKDSVCTLAMSNTKSSDQATYYCAVWHRGIKVFGTGTKLVVSEKKPEKPTVTVFPPSKDGTVMLVCLAEGYFPDVIKLEWKKNGETVSGAMVQDETDKATIMLKVTDGASFVADHYSCHVTHESLTEVKKYSIPQKTAQRGPVIAPTCPPYTDDKKKETSSLPAFNVGTFAYTLLILKSVTYCGIISILTSKTKSTQVLGIKKRVP